MRRLKKPVNNYKQDLLYIGWILTIALLYFPNKRRGSGNFVP